MKIQRLELRAFGPFTDLALDLADGTEGLHLIYGPNEAGKTTSLRAVRQLLFGIPHQSKDNFLHANDALRLAGTLRHGSGRTLEFVRRKAVKVPLREADDETPLDESALDGMLGRLDPKIFDTLFAIDHAALVRGGREVLEGKGNLGEILFAAGAGIAGLHRTAQDLQKEAEGLFTRTSHKRLLNQRMQALAGEREALRQAQLSAEDWRVEREGLEAARRRLEEMDARLGAWTAEQARLNRLRDALPLIGRRRDLRARLKELGDVPLLGDDFPELRRQALLERDHAAQQREDAARELAATEERLAGLHVPADLLRAEESIRRLVERRGAILKARHDRPTLQRNLEAEDRGVALVLRDLGRTADPAGAETLRLRADLPGRIRLLAQDQRALAARRDELQRHLGESEARSAALRAELDRMPAAPDPQPLRRALQQAQRHGDLETALAAALERRRGAAQAADHARTTLPCWNGTLVELEAVPLPLPETLTRFEKDMREAETRRHDLERQIQQAETRAAHLRRQSEELRRGRDVPSEDDLRAARARRDHGWQLLRRTWLDQRPEKDADARYLAEFPTAADVPQAFEVALHRADDLADRLRRESDVVGRLDQLRADLADADAARTALLGRLQEEAAAFRTLEASWRETIAPLRLTRQLSPFELRGWCERQRQAAALAAALRVAEDEVAGLQDKVAQVRRLLSTALEEVGRTEDAAAGLGALLERAQEIAARLDLDQQRRRKLQDALAEREKEQAAQRAQLELADQRLTAWRGEWAEDVVHLGLEPSAAPDQAETFLERHQELEKHLEARASLRQRLDGIDRDLADFDSDVRTMLADLAPDLAERDPAEAVEALRGRFAQAQQDARARRDLEERRDRTRSRLDEAGRAHGQASLRLDQLMREARVAAVADLPEAERRSTEAKTLRADLQRCEMDLLHLAAGGTLDDFLAQAEGRRIEAVEERLGELKRQLSALAEERDQAQQDYGSRKRAFEAHDGSAAAAERNEQVQSLQAILREECGRWAVLRLGQAVLRKAVERFRDRHQGPLLQRGSALFQRLTAGSFTGLRIDFDSQSGQPVLKGKRPDGSLLGVEAMSDGACDQLYLSLRLAALESWLEQHEPIPFVVDDILLNFDDERAVRALEALADLSRRTQVLFFTHHRHLVGLARRALDKKLLFVHELPAPEPATATLF